MLRGRCYDFSPFTLGGYFWNCRTQSGDGILEPISSVTSRVFFLAVIMASFSSKPRVQRLCEPMSQVN